MKLDISYGPRYRHATHPVNCLVCGVAVEGGDYAHPLFAGKSSEPVETCHEQCLP